MKIVKLSDLDSEERKKLIEEEQNRINQRNQERVNIQQQANTDFYNQIAKTGAYQNRGTTSLGILRKLYKNNGVTENSLDNYYNAHKNDNQKPMWDRIKESANNSLKQTTINMTGNPMLSLFGNVNKNVSKFITNEQKDKVGYIGKRTGAGVIQNITGIGQAGLTDLANQANKGKDKNVTDMIGDIAKSFTNFSNPISKINPIQTGINTFKTLADKDKNILQKGVSLTTGGISDTINQILPGKNVINSTTQLLGKINPNTSDTLLKYTDIISKPSEDINKRLDKEGQKYDTITNMLAGTGQTIGNMIPSIALSTINPTAGLGLMGLSAKGQATKEALVKGADLETAVKIGDTKGIVEIGTEMISGGVNIFGKGAIDDLVEKGIINKVKNKVGKQLVQWGVDNAGEVAEELISDVVGTIIDKGTTDPDAKYTWKDFGETATSTILSTTILNLITGGLTGGNINNIQQNVEKNQNNTQENQSSQQITQPQNNLSQNQSSEQIKAVETLKQEIQNSNLPNEDKTNMIDYINNNNIDQNTYKDMRQTIDNANKAIESNQEMLYNNSNESESDINGYTRNINERGNGIYKKQENQTNREYSWEEYNKWEESIKPISESILTDNEKQSISRAKSEHNKDIVIYNENDNDNIYSGGASQKTKNKIVISKQKAETFGLDKMIFHENVESDILHNDTTRDILSPVIDLIIKDDSFNLQKERFWSNQEGNIPSNELIAKDILCDRFSEIKSGEKLDYENVLSSLTNSNIDMSLSNYYKQVYGKELNINTQELEKSSSNILPKNQSLDALTNDINQQEIAKLPERKERKHYKSIMQSQYTSDEARSISKKMMGIDTYVPESNTKQLERADKRIELGGADSELNSLMSRSMTGGNIKADDIAVGERLIQYYSKIGDKAKLQDAIQATAMAGTTAGQTVQAMSLLNHQTPEGQAIWLQRSVEKMNETLKKNRGQNAEQFNLTPDMLDKIVNSKDSEQLQQNLNDVYEELGQQVTKSTLEKVDSWRYFSMLANPRTHIRNIVGNKAMGLTQQTKNKLAGTIEGIVSKINPKMERTHTIVPSSKEVKEFAKNDIKNVADRLGLSENKYNPKTRLQNSMRTFKSDILEKTIGKAFSLNDMALEAEDGWGLKAGYRKALAEYMTANGLTENNITDKQLAKARNYAVEEAKRATFHQDSQLATLINQLSNKNKFTKYTTDAILPFVKTPINVAKSGIEYSPVGLVKSAVLDTARLRKGDITINQYIDNISKGLTGTGIAMVGYALANCGILKASGGDDSDKESYDESIGKQTYSIQIGDNTYSLDWLAPSGIPLFIGAEISEMANSKSEEKVSSSDEDSEYNKLLNTGTNLLNAMANAMNPMTEMSMLSGLTSALSSYEQGSAQMIATIGTNSIKSYVNQFFPTVLGQIAKTTDEYDRSTTSTKSGVVPKAIDSTKNQIMAKIPGLRQKLPTKTDIWGNDIKQSENIIQRGAENAILPWTRKNISTNNIDTELTKLYEATGESSILPDSFDKTLTISGQKYRLTNKEYSEYKKSYSKISYELIDKFVSSKEYDKLTDNEKQKAIENIYTYAKETNKVKYARNNNKTIKTTTLYDTMSSLGSTQSKSEYLLYLSKIDQTTKEKRETGELKESQGLKNTDKIKILLDTKLTDNEKEKVYKNSINSEDKKINYLVDKMDFPVIQYLKYKQQNFENDKDQDGETISGTKKQKVVNYLRNISDSQLPFKYKEIICKMEGVSKINGVKNLDSDVVRTINNYTTMNYDEKKELLKSLGYKVDKNGRIQSQIMLPIKKAVK